MQERLDNPIQSLGSNPAYFSQTLRLKRCAEAEPYWHIFPSGKVPVRPDNLAINIEVLTLTQVEDLARIHVKDHGGHYGRTLDALERNGAPINPELLEGD